MPVVLYLAIVLGWLVKGVLADAGGRLWLVVLTVPAAAFYIWRTQGGGG